MINVQRSMFNFSFDFGKKCLRLDRHQWLQNNIIVEKRIVILNTFNECVIFIFIFNKKQLKCFLFKDIQSCIILDIQ